MNCSSVSPLFLFVFVVGLCFPCNARRPRAFVHIGPHKTGSTAIQFTLSQLTQNNKLPPGIATFLGKDPKKLALFARAVMRENDLTPHVPLLNQIYQNDKDIILSAEDLDMPSSIRATDQLSEILKDYDVTIVAFLREPLAHLISYWAELTCADHLRRTLSDFLLNRGLAQLKAVSSFPPPFEVEEIVKYKMEMNETIPEERTRRLIEGGNGWELFRTLDLYRHSFNVTTKKEKEKKKKKKKKEKKKREEEEEGGNKIVLIDFDGVLASEKTLIEVFLNEVVGLEDIHPRNYHVNKKGGLLTAIFIKEFYAKYGLVGNRNMKCGSVVRETVKMKKELEARGGLKACSEVIDFENMKREMDAYFSKKLEESGLEVLYGGKGKEWTGVKNCYFVDEEVGDSIAQMRIGLIKERKKARKKKGKKEGKKQSGEKEKREKDEAWGEVRELEEKVQERQRELKERQRKWEMEIDM